MRKTSILCALTILTSILGLQAKSWESSIPPFKPGPHSALKPTKLSYTLSWNGAINAGKLNFDFGKPDKRYPSMFVSQAYGNSIGPAALLFPYKYTITSFNHKGSYKPAVSIAYENDNEDTTTTTNRYKSSGVEHREEKTDLASKKKKVKSHHFKFKNSHDAVSAMLYIRGQSLKNGDKLNICIHPFASPYYANITVLGREIHRGKNCIKLDVKLRKIDLKSNTLKTYKKLKSATLWLTDDKDRIPLELRTKVFIGDVRAVLTSQKAL